MYRSKGTSYLQMYPELWNWMNRCLSCGHLGHKPELPKKLGIGVAAHHLRRYFPELALDENGLCPQCARVPPTSAQAELRP
jgi:hypothetical protein